MSDPIVFPSSSPRFGLPLLLTGQAQKEAFVNEAHALTDALLHCAIEGQAATPPPTPIDGTAWLVSLTPTGEWSGKAGLLACRQAGNWLYVTPTDGLRIIDRSTGQTRVFVGSWKVAVAPSEPSGGSIVDGEARAAITQLIAALRTAGVFSST